MTYDLITLPVGALETNCYLLAEHDSRHAVCIDPGGDADVICGAVMDQHLEVDAIILTHGHGDHIGAVSAVRSAWQAPVYVHPDDARMLTDAEANLSAVIGLDTTSHEAEHLVAHGDTITFGNSRLQVLHTPGHTRGGISLYLAGEQPMLFSGDALFRREIGRCDLPGGSLEQLCASIADNLYPLPDETVVYPGHGPATTIAEERHENPYVTAP